MGGKVQGRAGREQLRCQVPGYWMCCGSLVPSRKSAIKYFTQCGSGCWHILPGFTIPDTGSGGRDHGRPGRDEFSVWRLSPLCFMAPLRAVLTLTGLNREELRLLVAGASATFLRVNVALLLGTLWTVPVGVAIGFHPRLARVAQPLVQIAASVPATALFPVVLFLLVRVGGGLGVGFDRPAVARNAVVHPIQRDCGSNGYPDRSEGGHRSVSHYGARPLAKTHPARNFSLPGHGVWLQHPEGPGTRALSPSIFALAVKPFRHWDSAPRSARPRTAAILICSWRQPW